MIDNNPILIRSPETAAVFARDEAARSRQTWLTPDKMRAAQRDDAKRMAEYDQNYNVTIAELEAMSPRDRREAVRFMDGLRDIANTGRSFKYPDYCDRLRQLGVSSGTHCLFQHDREAIADRFREKTTEGER